MQKKDALTIVGVAVVAIVIGVVVSPGKGNLSSTPSITNNQPSTVIVPFTKLASGSQSTVERRVNYFITSTDGLHKLWKMVGATGTPPPIDFKTKAVIAVFAGKESTSSISVAKVEDTDTRMVSIALARPEGTCAAKQQTATPYEIVVVPTTSLSLAHKDIVAIAGCPK